MSALGPFIQTVNAVHMALAALLMPSGPIAKPSGPIFHPVKDWVEDMTGIPEGLLLKGRDYDRSYPTVHEGTGRFDDPADQARYDSLMSSILGVNYPRPGAVEYKVTNLKTGHVYDGGIYEEKTIDELHRLAKGVKIPGGTGVGRLKVTIGTAKTTLDMRRIDVGAMQAVAAEGTTFQVASNFNCLETTSPKDNPTGHGIQEYVSDRTQGPAAVISAGPGIWGRYYAPLGNCNPQVVQKPHEQMWLNSRPNINLLSNLRDIFTSTKYGYVTTIDRTKSMASSEAIGRCKIGMHFDIQTVFGWRKYTDNYSTDDQQVLDLATAPKINQVFGAALALGQSPLFEEHIKRVKGKSIVDPDFTQRYTKPILDAMYQGALLTSVYAYKMDSQRGITKPGHGKVVLTLMGGGVFNNPRASIIQAIEDVVPLIKEHNLDVELIAYEATGGQNEIRWYEDIVKSVGGQVEILPGIDANFQQVKGSITSFPPPTKALESVPPSSTAKSADVGNKGKTPQPAMEFIALLTGMKETDLRQGITTQCAGATRSVIIDPAAQKRLQDILVMDPQSGVYTIQSTSPAAETFQVGKPVVMTIGDMEKELQGFSLKRQGKFSIEACENAAARALYSQKVDISYLQSHAADGTTFQVGTNFMGLHPATQTWNKGSLTHDTLTFPGQYALASLSAAPGLFFRFFGPVMDAHLRQAWSDFMPVKQTVQFECGIATQANITLQPSEELYSLINHNKVAALYGVEVIADKLFFEPNGTLMIAPVAQKTFINQVFTPVLDVAGELGWSNKQAIPGDAIDRLIGPALEYAYKSAVLATAYAAKMWPDRPGSGDLVVSLLGVGSLGIPAGRTLQFLEKVIPLARQYGLQVKLIIYDVSQLDTTFKFQDVVQWADSNTLYTKDGPQTYLKAAPAVAK